MIAPFLFSMLLHPQTGGAPARRQAIVDWDQSGPASAESSTSVTRKTDNSELMPGLWHRLSHVAARRLPLLGHCIAVTRPFVSFTFDDFPASAARIGAGLLERNGACGTFYAATDLIDGPHDLWRMATREDIAALDAMGHEIGWHTHSHGLAWQYDASRLSEEYERSVRYLAGAAPQARFETFAYPFGIGCYWRKRQLSSMVRGARSVHPGVNRGWIDPGFLRAIDLSPHVTDMARIRALLDEAVRAPGWVIFFTHDVDDNPTRFGTTPGLLAAAIAAARDAGVPVAPVCEVLDQFGVPWLDGPRSPACPASPATASDPGRGPAAVCRVHGAGLPGRVRGASGPLQAPELFAAGGGC